MLKKLKCVSCGEFYNIDVLTWLDQTSNLITCPHCGNTNYVESDVIYEEAKQWKS